VAKQRGAYKGRKRILAPGPVAELAHQVAAATPKSELARRYGLSRETAYQYLRRHAAARAKQSRAADQPAASLSSSNTVRAHQVGANGDP
jgi:hypothetical protein